MNVFCFGIMKCVKISKWWPQQPTTMIRPISGQVMFSVVKQGMVNWCQRFLRTTEVGEKYMYRHLHLLRGNSMKRMKFYAIFRTSTVGMTNKRQIPRALTWKYILHPNNVTGNCASFLWIWRKRNKRYICCWYFSISKGCCYCSFFYHTVINNNLYIL